MTASTKARPMLRWVGKCSLDYVAAFPAQVVETFNPTGEQPKTQGLHFRGDGKTVHPDCCMFAPAAWRVFNDE